MTAAIPPDSPWARPPAASPPPPPTSPSDGLYGKSAWAGGIDEGYFLRDDYVLPSEPPAPKPPSWLRRHAKVRGPFQLLLVMAIALGLLTVTQSSVVSSGWAQMRPGPTFNVLDAVDESVPHPPGADSGQLLVTTVEISELNWPRYVWLRVTDSDEHLVAIEASTRLSQDEAKLSDVVLSEREAALAALDFIGADPATLLSPVGAGIALVEPGSPAEVAGLLPGDIITGLNGEPVARFEDLAARVDGTQPGTVFTLDIDRGGDVFSAIVTSGSPFPLGIRGGTMWDSMVAVDLIPARVQGASAGLVFALAYLDVLTSGSLTGGMVVAGTGAISSGGDVGPVQGVDLKAIGAASAGATVMFVPAGSVIADPPPGLTIVPVTHLEQAVAWLCANGATSSVCG